MKNENVICVSLDALRTAFDINKQYWEAEVSEINALPFCYIQRAKAEIDFNHKQLIPYAIVRNHKGEILCYQRHGSEKRLSDFYSVGIGGHVNDQDEGSSVVERLTNGLQREFLEEVGISVHKEQFNLIGMIDEEETEVGHCHTGVVFTVDINNADLTFDTEIGNPQWKRIDEMDLSNFEKWSTLALKLLRKIS
jgi:predicted NUDIX family phosphoesterase